MNDMRYDDLAIEPQLPRVLVIDDLSGREIDEVANDDRISLCAALSLRHKSDVAARPLVSSPIAQAEFSRGQRPVRSGKGDLVENDLEGTLAKVREGWTQAFSRGDPPWAMVLLDLRFYTGVVTDLSHRQKPGMPSGRPSDHEPANYFGWVLLDRIHRECPELPILMLSGMPRAEVSLEFSRRGALGFIDREDLRGAELLGDALLQHGLLPDPLGQTVGNSLPLLLALREARRAAGHRQNLLIRGERGTGKELLASYVHRASVPLEDGESRPFVTVNSAVFTPSLFAAELFGIKPRTATGVDGKIGLIESADRGDLFLDEIADMPGEVQAAMLRVLQERQITQVGGRIAKDVDVRFLSATNRDLETESCGFRLDLLDRLKTGGTLWLPPLRDRPTDIPLLVERFVREAEGLRSGAIYRQVSPDVLDALRSYDWPGNVRELRSAVFDAVNRHPDVEHFVTGHLRLGPATSARESNVLDTKAGLLAAAEVEPGSDDHAAEHFGHLLDRMRRFEFRPEDREAWAGKFGEFQSIVAGLTAKYIRAALLANRKPTPDNPSGDILIHPAVKLLTGDRTLTASRAADLIKRQLNLSPKDRDGILRDQLLRQAHEIAVRLRPTKGKGKGDRSEV